MIQKKNKKSKNNILLNLLFKSKNMYGESLNSTNKEILPFIYGSRYDRTIINLKNVAFVLKRVLKLMQHVLKKNKKILIIGNSDEIKFLFTRSFIKKNLNIIYLNKEWVNGLITNKISNTQLNRIIHYFLKTKQIQLIIIIKSSIKETFLNKEISTLKIPVISLINTSQSIKNINYPIVTNLKNIQSIYILLYLLRKIF